MADWSINWGGVFPAAPAAQTPAGPTQTASVDLGVLGGGHGTPAHQVFGCNCSTNPSGLSPAEIATAQAENLRSQGTPGFLR